jgi:uncharacterized protein YihD (DUF1040 family)
MLLYWCGKFIESWNLAMTKQEMVEVKKFIKKWHPDVKLEDMTDEFLLHQIKMVRMAKLKEMMNK